LYKVLVETSIRKLAVLEKSICTSIQVVNLLGGLFEPSTSKLDALYKVLGPELASRGILVPGMSYSNHPHVRDVIRKLEDLV